MAVPEQTPFKAHTGNGVTTVFAFDFLVLDEDDMLALVNGTEVSAAVYSVAGVGADAGGTVTFDTAPANGATVVLLRDSVVTRETDYQSNGDLLASVINRDFDRLWLVLQEIIAGSKSSTRTVRAPVGETLDELPAAASRAGKLLGFDSLTGALLMITAAVGSALDLAVQYASSAGSSLVGFIQAGSGAVLRTVQHKLRDGVSVKDFGAVGDGVADDSAAINAAIAASSSVYFPAGAYKMLTVSTLPANDVTLWAQKDAVILTPTNLAAFIRAHRGYTTTIRGINWGGAGYSFYFDAGDSGSDAYPHETQYFEYVIEDCKFLQATPAFYPLYFVGAREGMLRGNYFEGNLGAFFSGCVNPTLENNDAKNGTGFITNAGGTEGMRIVGGKALGCAFCLRVLDPAALLVLDGVVWDYNDAPVNILGSSRVLITNSYITSRTAEPAIFIGKAGANNSSDVTITDNPGIRSEYTAGSGPAIHIEYTDGVEIAQNVIAEWKTNGIEHTNCTGLKVHDNTIRPRSGSGTYSIAAVATSHATNEFRDNVVTLPISEPTSTRIWNNRGAETEFTGSATYDPASLADGAGVTTTVTATGCAMGDFARASFSLDLQGIQLTAWVSSANTVSVRFQNESGGPIDLGSGTIKVKTRRY